MKNPTSNSTINQKLRNDTMGRTLSEKILAEHTVGMDFDKIKKGEKFALKIDQTLTQDATGTMAYLQFEALGIPRVKTELSVSYVDHNTLQTDFKNADDHAYLQSVAAKYGIKFSKPGNGICHQVHLERFAAPGKTLLGSDSHTPTAGGVGSIAIGAGGLDVAIAMGGGPFKLARPKIMGIELTGELQPFVSSKDIILEILRQLDVKGGVGYILEYFGPGVKNLSVPERATITNMGAETGATTSIFPSDEVTKEFLKLQKREKDWVPLAADQDAVYDKILKIDLSQLEPLVAQPHSPGNVVELREIEGLAVQQVCIGSCTNSSYKDLMTAALMLKGKKVHKDVSLVISPGSRQVLNALIKNGALSHFIEAGARLLECACGPCIGMGQAPGTNAVTVRTYNRNFKGRTGTKSAQSYLVSPEVAAATAITGKLTDPRKLGIEPVKIAEFEIEIDDSMIIEPEAPERAEEVEIVRGPNIKPVPVKDPLPEKIEAEVLLKVGDNITTDHIMPAGKYLPLRSNVPEYAKHVFEPVDQSFPERAIKKGGGIVVGGENYGQGSSREHAALCPMYLGIKAVFAKSYARIHVANLVNFGIVPLIFKNPEDYEKVEQGDVLELNFSDFSNITVINKTKGINIPVEHNLSQEDIEIIKAGGKLNYTRMKAKEN